MILQTISDAFLVPLARGAAFILVILAIMWLIFGIYEGKRRGSYKERKVKDWDFKITKFLKVITYLGFLLGVICIITGISGLLLNEPPSVAYSITVEDSVNYFTSIFLIIVGVFTFLKPANDLPIATVVALLAGSAIVIVLASVIQPTDKIYKVIDAFISAQWFFIILFIIIFAITAVIVKFYSAGIMTLSKVISFPPLAIIISVFCFLQGFALLVAGVSIIPV